MWSIFQLEGLRGLFWRTCNFSSLLLFCLLLPALGSAANGDAALWKALRSGEHVALIRHALAPGFGDPPEFTLGDCSTQRNLSAAGRYQATGIGSLFRANGIVAARVFSSQWCRCQETAGLLGLGPVAELPVLNSFFADDAQREPQTRMLGEWLAEQDLAQPLLLVTHQVNITSFTGVYPGSGEIVIVERQRSGEFSVVGAITTVALD